MTKSNSEADKPKLNWWGVAAGVAVFVGWLGGFTLITWSGVEPGREGLLTLMALTILVSFSLNGVGLVLRASAHGKKGAYGIADGLGKVIGVFAWAFGATGSFYLAVRDTLLPPSTMGWYFGGLVLVGVIAIALPIAMFMITNSRSVSPSGNPEKPALEVTESERETDDQDR